MGQGQTVIATRCVCRCSGRDVGDSWMLEMHQLWNWVELSQSVSKQTNVLRVALY